MTCKEKFEKDHPNIVMSIMEVVELHCPREFGYPDEYTRHGHCMEVDCDVCWDREIPCTEKERKPMIYAHINPGTNDLEKRIEDALGYKENADAEFIDGLRGKIPKILDSGNRREFETGAVRDIQEGKGRCDLLPLDIVADCLNDELLNHISSFIRSGDTRDLYSVLDMFASHWDDGLTKLSTYDIITQRKTTMFLEVAKHYEEGCNKYGARNWEKGIPVRCYIDSGVRHYLKFLRGDKDEPHDRAFVWNMLGAIWTCVHKPELNEYPIKLEVEG